MQLSRAACCGGALSQLCRHAIQCCCWGQGCHVALQPGGARPDVPHLSGPWTRVYFLGIAPAHQPRKGGLSVVPLLLVPPPISRSGAGGLDHWWDQGLTLGAREAANNRRP
jgi:hypothetical protein